VILAGCLQLGCLHSCTATLVDEMNLLNPTVESVRYSFDSRLDSLADQCKDLVTSESELARVLAKTHKHGEQLGGALSAEQKQSADLALAFEEEQRKCTQLSTAKQEIECNKRSLPRLARSC